MKSWSVKVRREVTETLEAEVEVDADTEDEAKRAAEELANAGRIRDDEWRSESGETVSLEATEAECLTPDEDDDDGEEDEE